MKPSLILWTAAFFITVGVAVFQRVTGPTYPASGTVRFGHDDVAFRFERSHAGGGDAPVLIPVRDPEAGGVVRWRRHGTGEAWVEMPMARGGGALLAALPHQPPGGKLDYRVVLRRGPLSAALPPGGPVTIRFRGEVPAAVLFPHILAMFLAMLLSTRAGLEAFAAPSGFAGLVRWTIASPPTAAGRSSSMRAAATSTSLTCAGMTSAA